jgi:hypothetical protein
MEMKYCRLWSVGKFFVFELEVRMEASLEKEKALSKVLETEMFHRQEHQKDIKDIEKKFDKMRTFKAPGVLEGGRKFSRKNIPYFIDHQKLLSLRQKRKP